MVRTLARKMVGRMDSMARLDRRATQSETNPQNFTSRTKCKGMFLDLEETSAEAHGSLMAITRLFKEYIWTRLTQFTRRSYR